MHAVEGDTIASALIKNNQLAFRSTETGKNRGIFCGMGVCNECAVTVNGKEGILACVTPIENGISVDLQNQYIEGPAPDLNGVELPELEINCDVLIIGAGPAGLAAAKELKNANLKVVLVDERKALGGQYFKQPAEALNIPDQLLDSQFIEGRKLIKAIQGSEIEILKNTKIWGAFDPNHLLGYDDKFRYIFRAKQLIIATGAYERGIPISDWTLPGVFTTGAAQTLLRSYQTSIPGKIIISGNGPLNLQIAAELLRAKAEVLAYVDSAKLFSIKNLLLSPLLGIISPKLGLRGISYLLVLIRNKTKIISNSVPTAFIGNEKLSKIKINKIKASKISREQPQTFEVDSVAVGFGFSPSNEIAKLLGCKLVLDQKTLANKVASDFVGRTSRAGVWVIGDSASINGAQIAKFRGKVLAFSILKSSKSTLNALNIKYLYATINLARHLLFQKVLWQIFKAPRLVAQLAEDETIICRCLNVKKVDLQSDISRDIESAGALKRITRSGMGKCQGRYCSPIVQELISLDSGLPIDEFSGFAPQVPIKPTPISVIAYPTQNQDS
jgi:thioredoxin reductase